MKTNEQNISTIEKVRLFLLDIIFPTICLGCKKFCKTNICAPCRESMKFQNGFSCAFCHAPVVNGATCHFCRREHDLDQLLVALSYEHALVRSSIKAFKYSFVADLGQELGDLMATYLDRSLKNNAIALENTILVPVPLRGARFRWRGFNQSEVLAKNIAVTHGLPMLNSILKRIKNTRHQAEISNRDERIENMKNSFACTQPDVVQGRNIILIDDLSTTGSTLEQCAIVLKAAGAKKVSGFVLARG